MVARVVGFRQELEACGRIPSPVHSWLVETRGYRGRAEAADPEVRAASLGRLPAARIWSGVFSLWAARTFVKLSESGFAPPTSRRG